MLTKHTYKKLVWVDAVSPNNNEVKEMMQEYNLHPEVAEELLSPTLKPRLDIYDNFLYLILHFPAIKHTHSNEKNQEIDFIISKNFLITTRYDTVDSLHKFSQEFEVSAIVDHEAATKHGGFIFYYMIKKLYHSLNHELEYIESALEKIEDLIFKGRERQMVKAISDVSRNLLDMEKSLQDHDNILQALNEESRALFGRSFTQEFHDEALQSYKQLRQTINNLQEVVRELRETNNSLLSTKQNEVMKTLTIMAFVTFPLTLIASLFGMNTKSLPLVGFRGDFWIILGIMVVLALLFFWYFKHKKWL